MGLSLPLLRRMLAGAGVALADLWPRPSGPLVRDLTDEDRDWLAEVVTAAWGLPVVSLSGVHDVPRLPGLVAEQEPGGTRLGVLTYRAAGPAAWRSSPSTAWPKAGVSARPCWPGPGSGPGRAASASG